jgi:proteasome accessory factor A
MPPLFGLETEFGFTARGAADAHVGVERLVAAAGVLGPSLRDPSGAGVFLANGGRLYADGAHPEYATPEVSDPWSLVRYSQAGERLLERALDRVARRARSKEMWAFKANVHPFARTSWGSHESVLTRSHPEALAERLIPHLVSRVLYSGAGGFDVFSPGVSFVLSPRAVFINRPESESSTGNRPIVHTKDEPCSTKPYRRLHLVCGESLCSERAAWLRAATTVIVVALLDAGHRPDGFAPLANPVAALRTISGDPTCGGRVPLTDGRMVTAATLQRSYLLLAEQHAGENFMPAWTDRACRHWRTALDEIESHAASVGRTFDWAIKRTLFERVLARHGLTWELAEEWTTTLREGTECALDEDRLRILKRLRRELFACDLRFGQLGSGGLFAALDRANALTHRMDGVIDVDAAIEQPPDTTRAWLRGVAVRRLAGSGADWVCDWTRISSDTENTYLDLGDPFETEERWLPLRISRGREPAAGARAAAGSQSAAPADDLPFTTTNRVPTAPVSSARALPAAPVRSWITPRSVVLSPETQAAVARLELLLGHGFEVVETHCQLARVYLTAGDLFRARQHARWAWGARLLAPRPVVARCLWFQVLFALLDGSDWEAWLRRLRELMQRQAWVDRSAVVPALGAVRDRLAPGHLAMMQKLCRVLRGVDGADSLVGHAWWDSLSS